jgi:putative ABC transport system permease protein
MALLSRFFWTFAKIPSHHNWSPPQNANLSYIAQIAIVPSALLMSCAVGLAATVLAAILPARHVSGMPVVEALRQNF